MLKLAHLSDPHLGPLPDPKLLQLFSKRILGYLNWRAHRAKIMGTNYLEDLITDLKEQHPDHIAVTGDLVNIALPLEIVGARHWLDNIGTPEKVSVVPGNHDAYVPGALKKAFTAWRPFMAGDGDQLTENRPEEVFPYVRRRGDVAIVGVSTGRATGPWFATGRIGSRQALKLRKILEDLGKEDLFRVVLIHHPPFKRATHWHKRLSDASRVRAVLKRAGAELVLHGHTHIDSKAEVEGPNGPIAVIGVPSATNAPGGKRPAARYNLFSIDRKSSGWSCKMIERGFTTANEPVSELKQTEIDIPG